MMCLVLLMSGCKTPSNSPFKGGECRAENRMTTRAWQDSTYHYVRDSVVVVRPPRPPLTPPSKEGDPDALSSPPLKGELEGVSGLGEVLERWHTEWRERVVVKTDTVYQEREVRIQLPPERYVPRAVKWLAWAGGAAIFLLLLWVVLKITH